MDDKTQSFDVEKEKNAKAQEILKQVYQSLVEKGYNPINQIVGYILSGDPTYITSHNDARNLIRLIERDLGKSVGLTKDEIKKLKEVHPEIDDIWDYEKNIDFNQIEKMHDMGKRVYSFLDEIIEKYSDKNILLVTHGGVSVFIDCYFKKYPLNELHDRSVITGLKNCEVESYQV